MMWRQREQVRGGRPSAEAPSAASGSAAAPRPVASGSTSRATPPSTQAAASVAGRGELMAMARLAWALQRTTQLLKHVYASLGRSTNELTEVEGLLAQARMPDEYIEIAKRIAGLSAPAGLTPSQAPEVLSTFRRALTTVAKSVLAEGVAAELEGLAQRYDVEGDSDPQPLLLALTHLAEVVAKSRESSDVLHDALKHVQHGIRKIADEEEAAQHRIRDSRSRIAQATQVEELTVVKSALLLETERLEHVLSERRASLAALEKQSRSARRRAARLIAALADATTAAATDVLTGLGNRRALERAVELRAIEADGAGVLVIDIDHFKRVNDGHGHGVGDRVLSHIAELLQQELRGDDLGFRVGGEEFVVLLDDCDLEGALRTAERVRARVERSPAAVMGKTIAVTVSVGVGLWDGAAAFDTVFERTDKALYEAKHGGRNRCVAWRSAPSSTSPRRSADGTSGGAAEDPCGKEAPLMEKEPC